MDDGVVYQNGKVESARVVRERERIESALRAVESDLLSTKILLDQERERHDDRRHERRMLELRGHLARLTRRSAGPLIYKIKYDARL
jgi:hypothetical protein